MNFTGLGFRPELVAEYTARGYWVDTTSNEALEQAAAAFPERVALVDGRRRVTYRRYWEETQRLAAHWVALGLTSNDVIAIQLPNWSEFAIAVSSAMLAGIPFCQYHADFRSKEVELVLGFTEAAVVVIPGRFRGFDYVAMIRALQPRLPKLKHIVVVDDEVPPDLFDLRRFLAADAGLEVSEAELRARRPHGNAIARVAFTSGTTGDPKAVVHTHNTTNSALRFLNRDHAVTSDSAFLVFLPVGLNWGLFQTIQAQLAACKLVYMESFKPDEALRLIERERITHFATAPAGLVALLDAAARGTYDLSSLQVYVTGGASCPIEVIRRCRQVLPGHLLEMYGMLECGAQAYTRLDDDPEAVCGLVGKPLPEMGVKVVDDEGRPLPPGQAGEILTIGPSVTIGYYNNPAANAQSFTPDGWFRTGDIGVFDERGYLKIVGRKKEMIIRGGANIYPREIEEVLFKHPKVLDVAIIGVPDPKLGERPCACVVPRPGETLTLAEVIEYLKDKIATYKLPERLEIFPELPRTPTGKIPRHVLLEHVLAAAKQS
ncbi:MAG TPA: AMP-binding protein [candidate division Zixibacteria bacterium]|nr:AMP-binding protein [candidate division Zixibacteria bacterium]